MHSTSAETIEIHSAELIDGDTGTVPPEAPTSGLVTVIEPTSGWQVINVREIWRHRELLGSLALRDIKVRYKQTLLGIAWAVLQPLLMMLVFTIFLGRLARVPAGDGPYPLFVFAGLLPWNFFAAAVASSGNSVVGSERLISKIYFPRLVIPFASMGAACTDFCVSFVMLLAMMAWFHVPPTAGILLIPLIMVLLILTAAGAGTLLAALNVAYRDVRHVIPFLLQFGMFATPVIYMDTSHKPAPTVEIQSTGVSASERGDGDSGEHRDSGVPGWVKGALQLNPMTGLITFFRAAMLGGPLNWSALGYSACASSLLFLGGCVYFRRVEDTFADII